MTRMKRPPHRYWIPLQLGYKATSNHGSVCGFGNTRMMSSKEIIFGGGNGLEPGMQAEIVVAWPRLLDGRIRLQLVLDAIITGSQDGVVKARIRAYDFRTAGRNSDERVPEGWPGAARAIRPQGAPLSGYPVRLQLRYKAASKRGPLRGFGQTRMMSSKEIIFGGGNGLEAGMKAEIVLAWPPRLDDDHLQLVLEVMITGSEDGVVEARILAYDFRTAGLAKVETEELNRPPCYANLSGPLPVPQAPHLPAKPVH